MADKTKNTGGRVKKFPKPPTSGKVPVFGKGPGQIIPTKNSKLWYKKQTGVR